MVALIDNKTRVITDGPLDEQVAEATVFFADFNDANMMSRTHENDVLSEAVLIRVSLIGQ